MVEQLHKTASTLNPPAKAYNCHLLVLPQLLQLLLAGNPMGCVSRACRAASATHTCMAATCLPCSAAAAACGCAHRVAQRDCWLNNPVLHGSRLHALLCPCSCTQAGTQQPAQRVAAHSLRTCASRLRASTAVAAARGWHPPGRTVQLLSRHHSSA